MQRLRFTIANNWYVVLIGMICLSVALLVLIYKLGSLTGGLNNLEYQLWQNVHAEGIGIMDLLRNSLYLPYKTGLWVMQYLPFHGNGALRLIGVIFGLIGTIGCFALLKLWYSSRVAFFGAGLFLCSSWLLHTVRFASPHSIYAASAILLALWAWVLSGRYRRPALLLFAVTAVSALYIPGAIWLLVPAFIWQRRNLNLALRRVSLSFSVGTMVVAMILLIPFVLTILAPLEGTRLDAALAFLGLPSGLPSVTQFFSSLIHIPQELFITSFGDPTMNLGKLPLLDAFTTAMFVVGVYAFGRDWRLDRSRFIFGGLIVGSLLIALGGIPVAALLPFVYLTGIGGASYLLQEWLSVFPRNPFARTLGISLVVITVGAVMVYQLTNYFVAWPHAPETKQAFSQKL